MCGIRLFSCWSFPIDRTRIVMQQLSLPPHPFSYPGFHHASSSSSAMSTDPLDYPVTSFRQPGFSDGSLQYTDHENRHFLDHGGSRLQLGLSSTPFTGSTGPNATGLVISGSTSNIDVFRNQHIPNSNPQSWQWTPAASGRGLPDSSSEELYFSDNKST